MHLETIAIHGGAAAGYPAGAVMVPIYETVSYEFESAGHAAALFNLEVEGYRYSRIANPTVDALERRLALLEGGVGALAVSSGQAALTYALLNLVRPGQNVVAAPQLYGTTHTLLTHLLPGFGIEVKIGRSDQAADLAPLMDEQTRAVRLATLAHSAGVPLVVDNTMATPFLMRPIEFGADIVVHSLTKFLGGHGTTLGGAIIDSGRFDWARQRQLFPMFCEPDSSYHGLIYTEHFGAGAYIARCRSVFLRVAGATLAPASAFTLLTGTWRTRRGSPVSCWPTTGLAGSITSAFRIIRIMTWRIDTSRAARHRCLRSAWPGATSRPRDFMTLCSSSSAL